MTLLPRRIPKERKRDNRWRSQAHRDFVRKHACCNCGSMVNVQFAHVRIGSNAGMGQKPDDWRGVSLCMTCHTGEQHTKMGEPAFWSAYAKRTGQTVWALIDEFCRQSPRAREIREVRMERDVA